MDYSDGEVVLPECHIVKRKDMKLFCFFLDVFIAGLRSATVVIRTSTHASRRVLTLRPKTCSLFALITTTEHTRRANEGGGGGVIHQHGIEIFGPQGLCVVRKDFLRRPFREICRCHRFLLCSAKSLPIPWDGQ